MEYYDKNLLLTGQSEINNYPKDFNSERIVPDFAFNILNKNSILYKPILDVEQLVQWPNKKKFAVCLTHDVDNVTKYSIKQSYRGRLQDIRQTKTLTSIGRNLGGFTFDFLKKLNNKKDPLHNFEKWLNIESKFNAKSTFFFWPGFNNISKHHISDCTYNLNDIVIFDKQKCTVSEMIVDIDKRGWEIGLHPSWYSYNNLDEMKRQKNSLELILKKEVVSVRQHQLHHDLRITPEIHTKAGFLYDSTLGFNDNIGFRFGTSFPWRMSINNSNIIEIPLIAQDGALLSTVKGLRLDEDTAFEYLKMIINEIEKVGGVATFVWHPDVLIDTWWNLYLRLLEFLEPKNPFFGTIEEIGELYKNQVSN
jgi:peptidoglycan/xylan/chitin deacetylase (PgdA/CDA1 family)